MFYKLLKYKFTLSLSLSIYLFLYIDYIIPKNGTNIYCSISFQLSHDICMIINDRLTIIPIQFDMRD